MTDPADLSALEALAAFRSRQLSPVELMQAVIARAERVEPVINAFTHRFFEEALEAARQAERRYLGKGPRPRALEGLPLAIKDEMPVAGQPNTFGSIPFKDQIADHTAPLAERALRAGAIIHARTTQPEFACMPFTHSRLYGITRNPWNSAYDVGGSSGGAAASLAAGTTVLAGGSDIGGSIRIPASCCGVVGFKLSYGRVPQDPPFNLDHYCHEGPLARTVGDCALFAQVIAGPHPHDIASLPERISLPLQGRPEAIKGWRIALSLTLGDYDVDDDVRRNTLAVAEVLREAGAIVEEVELSWRRSDIMLAAMVHYGTIFGAWVKDVVTAYPEDVTRYAIAFAEQSTAAAAEPGAYLRGLEIEGRIYRELGDILARYHLLLCPTLALPALQAGNDHVDEPPAIGGARQAGILAHLMTIPFNICSRCPVMSIPSGFAQTGVPTGVQLVGRPYQDRQVVQAAYVVEERRPWLDSPERRPRIGD